MTLVTSFDYGNKMISWESKSNGSKSYNRDRGSLITGTTGLVLVDQVGYEIYDLKGTKTSESETGGTTSSADLTWDDTMNDLHFANFIVGVQKGEKLNAPVRIGKVALTMLRLANIAWQTKRELELSYADANIQHDAGAMKLWGRDSEKGWLQHL
jgi:hypothetical protein